MAQADFISYTLAAREVSKNRTRILRGFARDFMATFAIVLAGPIVYWLASATTNGLIFLSSLTPGFGIGFMLARRQRADLYNQIEQLSRDPIARLVWCQEIAWDAYRPAVYIDHRTSESQLPIAHSPEERADVA